MSMRTTHIQTWQTMMLNLTAEEVLVSDSRWRQPQSQQPPSGSAAPGVRRRSSVMSLSSLPNMPISAKDIESRGKRRALSQEAKEASVHESRKYDVRDSAQHIVGDDELWREFKAKLDGCGHLTNVATHELLCEFLIQSSATSEKRWGYHRSRPDGERRDHQFPVLLPQPLPAVVVYLVTFLTKPYRSPPMQLQALSPSRTK